MWHLQTSTAIAAQQAARLLLRSTCCRRSARASARRECSATRRPRCGSRKVSSVAVRGSSVGPWNAACFTTVAKASPHTQSMLSARPQGEPSRTCAPSGIEYNDSVNTHTSIMHGEQCRFIMRSMNSLLLHTEPVAGTLTLVLCSSIQLVFANQPQTDLVSSLQLHSCTPTCHNVAAAAGVLCERLHHHIHPPERRRDSQGCKGVVHNTCHALHRDVLPG
jgi:hypothetical protein